MSVSGATVGVTNNGTASVAYALPTTGYDANSGTLCFVAWGGPSPYTPPSTLTAGWSLIGSFNGGSGATYNTNQGNRGVACFWATGAAPAAPTIDLTGLNVVQVGRCLKYQKTLASWSTPVLVGVADAVNDTTFGGTFPSDPGGLAGDMAVLMAGWILNSNTASAPSLTWPGMTVGSLASEMSTSTSVGRAVRGVVYDAALTGGPSSGAPSGSMTSSAAGTGAMGLLRLRDFSAGGPARGVYSGGIFNPASSYGIWNGSSFVAAASSQVI